jgi:hypothetical protein
MSKYTFIEFIAAQEGNDFNVIEGDNLAWARSFVKGMGDLPNWEHEGDCTKQNHTCTLCVYELYLKEYREYYFDRTFNEQKMDFIKRCIDVYWEHYANSSHEDNLNDWNISQNILNKQ